MKEVFSIEIEIRILVLFLRVFLIGDRFLLWFVDDSLSLGLSYQIKVINDKF